MASYNELNALIDAYINRNGVQAITGQILNGVLKAVVEQLGRGYTIMDAATPATDPGTPDGPECYFASEPGTYTDFDGLQVAPGELALLCYTPSDGWTKATIYEGFRQVGATIDGNVGTPSVGVSYANGVLSFDFHNMKGNPGQNGQDGQDGAAAGFGTIGADITGGVGTPGVSVESSGPATAKNLQFHFTNLKGETGVTSVVATVDNTTGTPACTVSLVGQQLTLAFSGLKGAQGDTGSSVDYPFTIVNNLTTDDATQALSAAQGVVLDGKVTQLEADVAENGMSKSVFQYSQFAAGTPNITLQNNIKLTQQGDYVEIKVKANGTAAIIDMTAGYNNPMVKYSSANTIYVRFTQSATPFTYQNTTVDNSTVQTLKIALTSKVGNDYTFSIYLDGTLIGTSAVTSTGTIQYDLIGWNTTMALYYIKGKDGGMEYSYEKFSEMEGATGITDVYTYESIPSLSELDARVSALEDFESRVEDAIFGVDMFYQFNYTSGLWLARHDFRIYQRLVGNTFIMTAVIYYYSTSNTYPNGYWRVERTSLVTIEDGVINTIQDQIITAGENEFVLNWLAGNDYNADGGFTGGFHFGEKIDGVTGAWVEFIVDGNKILPTEDIPLTPCKSFLYREYSAIYNCHDNPASIAAWHLKETEFKNGGYETINDVKFVQALDYFAYPGIVCISRWLSEYAMPEGVATITDMGDGSTTIAEQFKSNGHCIHYEGNGYMCDVESEVLIGADDAQCQRVVYNSSAYNKFYRRNPDTVGSTSNRLKGRTKVKISAM